MEVKVLCNCGSKYKFDVEPVNERMPWPVNCPTCGADGTAQSNEVIAQTIAANPGAVAPAPVPIAPAYTPAPAPVAAAPAPAPAPGGLRINKQVAPAAPPPMAGVPPPAAGAPPRFTPATVRPLASATPKSSASRWSKIGGGTFGGILALTIIILKIWRIVHISHAIYTDNSDTSDLVAGLKEVAEMNLMADDSVVLYVKHDDYQEVAQDCVAFWKEKNHQNFHLVSAEQQTGADSQYQVFPAHNGYVRIVSNLQWKDPMFEATAQHLSKKYDTLVFDEKDVDFNGDFVFGVYDQGSNVFRARTLESKRGGQHTTVEHIEWAKAHGYKPGTHGQGDFNVLDANTITKSFGMKFWDERGKEVTNFVVLAAAN